MFESMEQGTADSGLLMLLRELHTRRSRLSRGICLCPCRILFRLTSRANLIALTINFQFDLSYISYIIGFVDMENNYTPISPDQTFTFSCSRKISCFNECCRDLNQFLTPYDILRLKNRLGLSSTDFLKRYTKEHTGPESGLPIIVLKPDTSGSARCPFVKPVGCSVYEDRPSSCRMYPLMRVISRSRETARLSEQYLLLKEGHCQGFQEETAWTIKTWQDGQGLGIYNEMNDRMLDIISLKNRRAAGPLDPESTHLFYLSLYDLDRFRTHIRRKDLPDMVEIPDEKLDQITNDDEAFLKFAFNWVQQVIFHNRDYFNKGL